MGSHKNVSYHKFPKQSNYLYGKTKVCFNYNAEVIKGVIVRDDMEDPFVTIIKLEDGRHILGIECMYSPILEEE